MALYTVGTMFASPEVAERRTTYSIYNENALANFEHLQDLVPDLNDNTSVVCIANRAQNKRVKKLGTVRKISSCINIKRKRLLHQSVKKIHRHHNIVKGLLAYVDGPQSQARQMYNVVTYITYGKSSKRAQQSVEDLSLLEKRTAMCLANTRCRGQTLTRSL